MEFPEPLFPQLRQVQLARAVRAAVARVGSLLDDLHELPHQHLDLAARVVDDRRVFLGLALGRQYDGAFVGVLGGGVDFLLVPFEFEPGGGPVPERREFLGAEFDLLAHVFLVDFLRRFGVEHIEGFVVVAFEVLALDFL